MLWQVYRDLLSSITSVEDADKKMAELASQGKIDPAFLQITAKVGILLPRLYSSVLPVKSGTAWKGLSVTPLWEPALLSGRHMVLAATLR